MSSLLFLLVASFCNSISFAGTAPIHFEIPAGDAQKTLAQFLSQANIEMLYSPEDVRGITTHAVSGNLTAAQALMQMFDGSNLEITFAPDLTYASIKPAKKIDTLSDAPPSHGASTAMPPSGSAVALPDIPLQAFEQEPKKLEEVVVTGTLIHGVLDIMSPLTFVTRNDMTRTGYATVQDALQALTLSGGGAPSEDYAGNGNFARGVAANLRGLGAGATLVLIDGHRQPVSGALGDFVDISNIPWSAVERIEVLPDGASALYGSDAIAGVVNVIMRKKLPDPETWVRFGVAPGGGDEKLIAQLFGTNWQSGHALFSYQYSERDMLAAAERAYAANTDKTALGGTDHRSFRSSPGNILDPKTLQPTYAIPSGQDGSSLTAADLLPGTVNLQNRYTTYDLLPDKRTHSLFFSGVQELGDRLEVLAEGRYAKRHITQQIFGWEQTLLVPTTNPFAAAVNPYPNSPFVVVGYNFLDTLGPLFEDAQSQTYSGSIGLKASVTDTWRITLSGSYGYETLSAATHNLPDQAALNKALASSDATTAFNPFGDGSSNSAAVIDAIRFTQLDRARSSVTSASLVGDGTVMSLPSGDAKLALGGGWRAERFGNALGGGLPFARDIKSAYAELSAPIIGKADNPRAVPRLELSLAGRYEDYSDFGSTWNPKIGLRFAPSNSFKVRSSWGTSFRAPRLNDLYDTSHNVIALSAFKDPASPTGTSVVLISQTNNPDLEQETAKTWTAGVDFAPQWMQGSKLSLTYYSINYTGRVVIPGPAASSDILLQADQWASVISRSPTQADIAPLCDSKYFRGSVAQCKATPVAAIIDFKPRNLAATRVRGIDLQFDQPFETSSFGHFQFSLAGSYLFNFDQAASNTSPMSDIADTIGNPLSLRVRGTADWSQHGWDLPGFGASASIDHTGRYKDQLETDRGVARLTTIDLQLSYRTPKGTGALGDLEFLLNAANIFNQTPPFVDREEGYDIRNTDPYGRIVSFSIQKKW